MNKLMNSHIGIGVLVAIALLFVYRNIVSPLMHENAQQGVAVIEDDVDDWHDGSVLDEPNSQQSLQIASVRYDAGHFNATDLHWNEHPDRDPFKPRATLDVGDVASIVNKVKESSVDRVGRAIRLPSVSAIVKGETINFAVIDDQIVTEGDRIADFRVEQLARASVTLRELTSGETYNVWVRE
ncbi:MAG: hypothetical protein AAAFM81_13760 [Pseudomonadota bacterium]